MIHRLNLLLLSLILVFAPAFAYAAALPTPSSVVIKDVEIGVLDAVISATETKRVVQAGSILEQVAEATVKANAAEVGGVMSKRISKVAKGGGVLLLGVAATEALLEGIGWVMEEGVYVKHKINDIDPNAKYLYRNSEVYAKYHKDAKDLATAKALAAQFLTSIFDEVTVTNAVWKDNVIEVKYYRGDQTNNLSSFPFYPYDNPDYNPDKPKEETIPITDEQMGCAILGLACYHDPVSPELDVQVENSPGDEDIVEAAATPDPNADETTDSNPIAKKIKNALDNAPKTTKKAGTDGKTESTTEKSVDENGNEITKTTGDFKLPAFCDWAALLCDTQPEIKENTKNTTDELKKQTDQDKTFFEKVTAWFDWTQDEDIPDKDDIDIEDQDMPQIQEVNISWSAQCPPPVTATWPFTGVEITLMNWQPACDWAPLVKPFIILGATIQGFFIISGNREE